MTIREIVTPPDPVLRSEAERVRAFTSDLRQLVDDMVETMREADGVGLAAPQVGVSQQVIVVEWADAPDDPEQEPDEPILYKLVNPEIVSTSPQTTVGTEGCLSLPRIYGDVERSVAATVRGFTPSGDATQIRAEGWLARIFLHEVDHLNGVLFIDHADRVWKVDKEQAGDKATRA